MGWGKIDERGSSLSQSVKPSQRKVWEGVSERGGE